MQLQVNRDNPLNGNDIVPPKKEKKNQIKSARLKHFVMMVFQGSFLTLFVLL